MHKYRFKNNHVSYLDFLFSSWLCGVRRIEFLITDRKIYTCLLPKYLTWQSEISVKVSRMTDSNTNDMCAL